MGGYPEARELAPADRQEWFKTYLDDLLTKDIQDITEIRKVDTLRKVATSLVAHSAQFIAVNELSAKAELAKVTLGIEVKAGSSLGDGDFKHLKWFAKNLAKGEFTGIVLYSGERTLRFGEGFYAVPLAALGA